MHVGERIKEMREKMGLTQEELAERIGVKRNTVWRWENGKAALRAETLERISSILSTETSSLMVGVSEPSAERQNDSDLVYEWEGHRLSLPNTPETRVMFERLVMCSMANKPDSVMA